MVQSSHNALCFLSTLWRIFTNKQYIFITTSKGGPSTLGPSEKPQIEIHVPKSEDEIIPRKTGSKYSRPMCLSPVAPWWTYWFLCSWPLSVFLQEMFFLKNACWAVIVGRPSVSVSVCCSLGEERACGCWPLAQTGAELLIQLLLCTSVYSHTRASPLTWSGHCFGSLVAEEQLLLVAVSFEIVLWKGCNSENMYFSPITYSFSMTRGAWVTCSAFKLYF